MSLQIWLPQGFGNNKGLYNIKTSLFGGSFYDKAEGGKVLSKCLSFDMVPYNYIFFTDDLLNNNIKYFSIAFWVKLPTENTKPREDGKDTNYMTLFCDRTSTGNGLSIFYNPAECGFRFDTGSGANNQAWFKYSNKEYLPKDWTHYCFTYDGTKKRVYINGVEWSQVKQNGVSITAKPTNDDWIYGLSEIADSFSFGVSYETTASSYLTSNSLSYSNPIWQNSYMNDLRVYDHALSPREVKLLAQGLVAHYKLDAGNPNLLNTLSSTRESEYYNYKFDRNGFGRFLTNGETCTLTICFTPTSNFQKFRPHFDNGNVPCTADYPSSYSSSISNGQRQIITLACASNYAGSNTPTTSNTVADLRLYVRRNSDSTYDSSVVTIHWVKLQIGAHTNINTWSPSISEQASYYNTEYDCSGYGRHLVRVGSPRSDTISARYTSAINFNQSGYFKKDDFNFSTEQFTYAFWIKMPSSSNGQHFLFGSHDSWPNNGFSAWRDKNSNSYNTLIKSSNESSYTGISFTPDANQWTHITYTYSGTSLKYYKNGEFISAITYGGGGAVVHPVMYIGNSRYSDAPPSEIDESAMSDFRLYATALSEPAVRELYQSSISFLDNGTLQCSEIVENSTNLKYNQNGIVQGNELNEIGYVDQMKIKTLSDGSAWARIHWLDVSSNATYFANEAEVKYCINQSNRFSLMGYVEYFKSKENKYEFMLTYPALSSTGYNRWRQTSSPNASSVTDYEPVPGQVSWSAHCAGLRAHNPGSCIYNCDTGGTWYAPIGQLGHGNWNGTGSMIPAANGSNTSSTELWVRIDNLPKLNKLSMFDKAIQTPQIYEL